MPQSLAHLLVHIAFSTKGRTADLHDPGLRADVFRYLAGVSKKLDCPPAIIGGWVDHVHILAHQNRTISLADWVKELKRASTHWLHSQGKTAFHWQLGYGAFSVSHSRAGAVRRYIQNQESHHCKTSFQIEFRDLLDRHGLAYDDRYVWD